MIATAMSTLLVLILSFFPEPIMAFTSPSRAAATGTARLAKNIGHVAARKNPSSLNAIKEATFGMGCFWEPAESLLKHPGVLATTVGYTGAPPNKPPPSYDTVCFGNDYVEAVRVVYDDTILDYTTLLDEFFDAQKPGLSRQYASIVFVDDTKSSEQQQAMEWKSTNVKTKVKRSDNLPYEIVEIEPLSKFYRAEEYHQRYWEKQRLRAAIAVVLLAGSSGAFDDLGGGAIGQFEVGGFAFDTICNGVFLVGAAWMILERLIARDVRELRSGDLIAEL